MDHQGQHTEKWLNTCKTTGHDIWQCLLQCSGPEQCVAWLHVWAVLSCLGNAWWQCCSPTGEVTCTRVGSIGKVLLVYLFQLHMVRFYHELVSIDIHMKLLFSRHMPASPTQCVHNTASWMWAPFWQSLWVYHFWMSARLHFEASTCIIIRWLTS